MREGRELWERANSILEANQWTLSSLDHPFELSLVDNSSTYGSDIAQIMADWERLLARVTSVRVFFSLLLLLLNLPPFFEQVPEMHWRVNQLTREFIWTCLYCYDENEDSSLLKLAESHAYQLMKHVYGVNPGFGKETMRKLLFFC